MGANTKIGWTSGPDGEPGHTHNSVRGCSHAVLEDGTPHEGCVTCYAELGYGNRYGITWGPVHLGGTRDTKAESGWQSFLNLAKRAAGLGRTERVFMFSLGDVLEEVVIPPSAEWEGWPQLARAEALVLDVDVPLYAHPHSWIHRPERERLIAHAKETAERVAQSLEKTWDAIRATASVCGKCGGARWRGGWEAAVRLGMKACDGTGRCSGAPTGGFLPLLLTKRPDRAHLVPVDVRPLCALGGSVSDAKSAESIISRLLSVRGAAEFALLFLSMEPLVGGIDMERWLPGARWYMARCTDCGYVGSSGTFREHRYHDDADVECPRCYSLKNEVLPSIGWVITGGESGALPKVRAFYPLEHAAPIMRQARLADVPGYLKQMGSLPVMSAAAWEKLETKPARAEGKKAEHAPAGTVALAFTGKGEDATEWAFLFDTTAEQLQQVPNIIRRGIDDVSGGIHG